MHEFNNRYGTWALIAGSAEGLGEGFSVALAKMGFNLVMVDHHADSLQAIADKLESEFHIQTIRLCLDLGNTDAANQCLASIETIDCRLLMFVAAYSRVQRFTKLQPADLDHFLDINCRTMLHLVHAFSNRFIDRKKSAGIILVSSLAGLIGPQFVAVYAATKSFGMRLAESLHEELKLHDIDIMACAVGMVATPTFLQSKPSFARFKPSFLHPEVVAQFALCKLGKKTIAVPGIMNRVQYFILQHLMSRSLASKLVNKAMKKMYEI